MKTAAAFAKGFLELEGELTPILVSLVSKESSKTSSVMMLDQSGNKDIKKDMERRFVRLHSFIRMLVDDVFMLFCSTRSTDCIVAHELIVSP